MFCLPGSTRYSGKSLLADSMLLLFLITHTRTVSTQPIRSVLLSAHRKLHLNLSIETLKPKCLGPGNFGNGLTLRWMLFPFYKAKRATGVDVIHPDPNVTTPCYEVFAPAEAPYKAFALTKNCGPQAAQECFFIQC